MTTKMIIFKQLALQIMNSGNQNSNCGSTNQIIWTGPEIVQYLSRYAVLQPGDLITTGTPAGVEILGVGDHVRIQYGDLLPI